jgi:HD-GYP domain-containing protein (c-di-GMP phosphodiesterase class II)
MKYEEAVKVIKKMRGGHLCPECVDAFLSMMKDGESDAASPDTEKQERMRKKIAVV